MVVTFQVYKASKFLFTCKDAEDPPGAEQQQQYPRVRVDEMEAFGIEAVNIVKRLEFSEVDRMIACCRQHPPQVLVAPASTDDIARFREFSRYLRKRQRAGVGTLSSCLLLLAPLEDDELRLRCLAVKTKANVEDAAAISSSLSSVRIDEAGAQSSTADQQMQASSSAKHLAKQSNPRGHAVKHEAPKQPPVEAGATEEGDVLELDSMPRLKRATYCAQLRQEYEAFNALHYRVLQEWSSKPPDN